MLEELKVPDETGLKISNETSPVIFRFSMRRFYLSISVNILALLYFLFVLSIEVILMRDKGTVRYSIPWMIVIRHGAV